MQGKDLHTKLFFVVFFKTEFPSSYGVTPETHSVDQAGLELTEIRLQLPPECWN